MQLVRESKFHANFANIRKEYHDGGIVVETYPAEGQPSCVALWDVDKETVQLIVDHPSQFDYPFKMTHHPFQIVVKERQNPQKLLLVKCGQPTRNSVVPNERADTCSFCLTINWTSHQMAESN